MGERLQAGLRALEAHPLVGEARGRGMLAALELVRDKASKARFEPSLKLGDRLFGAAYANGLIVRAFADGVLGFAPPLCCTAADVDLILVRTRRTLDDVLEDPEVRAALG